MRFWGQEDKNFVDKNEAIRFIKYFAGGDNWHGMDLKTGNIGYGWLHYSIIRMNRVKRVLCIGSKWGLIPAICAAACRDNERGVVDFVDAGFDIGDYSGPDEHWGGVGWWKKCNPKTYFGKFGLEKYIRLWVMKSEEYKKKYSRRKYGYIYIDGDHSYEGVKKDFEMFWPRVEKGGFLAVHDIGSRDKDGNVYGTRQFWAEIKKSNKYQLIEVNEDPGVGIVQKVSG